MIWPGRAAAPLALGNDTWATRSPAGPVPAGWVGLRVSADGQCTAWAEPGQPVPAPRFKADGGTAWWVRSEPWPCSFAPWPDLAPEAGVAITLCLDCPPGSEHRTLLAARLADEPGDVTAALWARELRPLKALQALPPCATPAVLGAAANELSRLVWPAWQVRATALQRLDLALPHNMPAGVCGGLHAEASTDQAEPQQAATGAPVDAATVADTARSQRAPTLATMLAEDRAACRQLAQGLPRLGLDLAQRWAGGGWSSNADVAARQRNLSQAIGLMASSLGALPSLQPRAGARRDIPPAQRSMVWLQALQAAEALASALAAEQALPPARTPPEGPQLHDLEQAVAALQAHLRVRQLPWWE